ncbi:hypothetical protein E2C01_024603 [Portunus trituberculatus]|uniref:Uncharacterized protein n=1 Tax=Portunus trituberculatus TaxID=210409 RepID=A0A5B7EDA7_PORTR|nr:hypothetical protein [Portunus trituberculatus]
MFTMAASITVFPLQTQTEGMTVVLGMWGAAMGTFLGLNSLHTISVVGLDDYAAMMGAWNLTLALSFVTIGPFLVWCVMQATAMPSVCGWRLFLSWSVFCCGSSCLLL